MDSNTLDFYLDSPELEAGLINDDGSAAKQHLAAGRAERRVTVIRDL